MILVGVRLQIGPAGETDEVKATCPVNPFSAVTVIVEVPEDPARIWAGVTALADMLKSGCGVKVTITARIRVPLVPVTVTLKLTVHVPPPVRVDVFGVGRVTEAGEMEAVQPVGGSADVIVRAILPVNPLSALAVMVDIAVPGGTKLTVAGLAPRMKLVTWKRIVAVV